MSIEQSLNRIHSVRDAYLPELERVQIGIMGRIIGANRLYLCDCENSNILEIETVSDGCLYESGKEFKIKFADGKDLAQTLEGLAIVAEQFMEVL